MTLAKEEVEDKIELILDSDTGSDCTVLIDELLAHDAEQRLRIEEMQDRIDRQANIITEYQATEEALREALQGILEIGKRDMTNPKYDGYFEQAQQALKAQTESVLNCAAKVQQQAQQIATLREVLKELYALVQGECPSLLNEDSGGDAELDLKIEQALKESYNERKKNG